ncbi:hypothetical protein BL243_04785 [Ralstonia solanacearum]|nr:hypothetical protein BL243_04785 [Ralstonia solanacearum]
MTQTKKFFDDLGTVTARRHPSVTVEALELVRGIVREGHVDAAGDFLKAFVGCIPTAKLVIREQLPGIILNHHLVQKDILAFDEFLEWTKTYPKWHDTIGEAAFDGRALEATVNKIEQSMRLFAETSQPTG